VPVLEAPLDKPRPARPTFHGTRHAFRLPADLVEDLHAQAQREGVTLFMLLLAAWGALLARFSGQHELLIGSPSNRRLETDDTKDLIGLFIQMLALRLDLSGNPTLRGLLQRVRQVTTEAQAHAHLPYDAMVDELLRRGHLPRRPPLTVGLVLYPKAPAAPPSALPLAPYSVGTPTSHFELSLTLAQGPAGIDASLEYNTDLFVADTIRRLAQQLTWLLRQMPVHPEWPLDAFSPLPPGTP
jgi:non-ribosomal peptide synthetase component F